VIALAQFPIERVEVALTVMAIRPGYGGRWPVGRESRNVWIYDDRQLHVDQADTALAANGGSRVTHTYFTYGPASDGSAVRDFDHFVVDSRPVRCSEHFAPVP
jgi:hypothetical protein